MKTLGVALALSLFTTGCLSTRVEKFASVDRSQKTMTVPMGSGLAGELKRSLARDGWQTKVYGGPTVTQRTETGFRTGRTFDTRYTLFLHHAYQFDTTFPDFDAAYHFDLSVVDNRTGTEALTMSGSDGGKRIARKFMESLR